MSSTLEEVLAEVAKKITPSSEERRQVLELAEELKKKVREVAEIEGIEAEVRLEGSVAKDTWLSGEPDIDIFMRVPVNIPREEFGRTCLKVARRATKGSKQIERFAEHPYLEAIVDDTTVNIVPCYKVELGEWRSATDRTPFHTNYIKPLLDQETRREIRLLKKFMKGIGAYGAEIRIGGFSGYLCELLVLNDGSFADVLESFAGWEGRIIVDHEGHYADEREDLKSLFEERLVVVDPVDQGRNVAAAVTEERLSEFVAAARRFLKNPDGKFFYPSEIRPFSTQQIVDVLKTRGSTIVFVRVGRVNAVPDVLWGQLYKSQKSLKRMLQRHDFTVIRDDVWSDRGDINVFIFETEKRVLPRIERHLGPPLAKRADCERFLQKHIDTKNTLSGPRVEKGRWVVEIKRKHREIADLLTEKLRDGGRSIGVADLISQAISEFSEILINEEILEFYSSDPEFAKCLTEYLQGRPRWLQ